MSMSHLESHTSSQSMLMMPACIAELFVFHSPILCSRIFHKSRSQIISIWYLPGYPHQGKPAANKMTW